MATIKQLRGRLSKLRQRRHYLEKRCEQTSKMLSASLIFRKRTKEGTFQRAEMPGVGVSSYLTYLWGGTTRHHYVRKRRLSEIRKLTDNYREFSLKMAQVRALNREIVTLLDRIGKIQQEEVSKYVKKRINGTVKKKSSKQPSKKRKFW